MSQTDTSEIIHLASDHAGFQHKEAISEWLTSLGYKIVDHGAFSLEPDDDYTDTVSLAAAAVKASPATARAVIFGGSGEGEAMLANRYPNVRATVYYADNLDIIKLSREHNDANVLSIGARFVSIEETKIAVDLWLSTPRASQERHLRRNQKLESITKQLRTI